jgi:SWI/SNF-related matrix-associated actin-dependent regulator 1 of chromatin subfamily A
MGDHMHLTIDKTKILIHKADARTMRSIHAVLDKKLHCFVLPYTKENIKKLQELDCIIPEHVKQGLSLELYMKKRYLQASVPASIAKDLFTYQVHGVRLLQAGFSLLADYMGLGKTITAIAFMKMQYKNRAVVVCPAFLKEKWSYEIQKWSNLPTHIIYGQQAIQLPRRGVYIINYDILQYHVDLLARYGSEVVIGDEFHVCRNDTTYRTKAMRKLVASTDRFIALTGTPIMNNAIDLYPVLNMLDPLQFYSRKLFEEQYCKLYQDRITGSKNHDQLFKILKKSIMIRRTFADVQDQLPQNTIHIVQQVIPFRLESYDEYQQADMNIDQYLLDTIGKTYGQGTALQKPRILQEISYKYKKEQVFAWLDNFLLEGEKITLFFTRTQHLKEFAERYDATVIYGATSAKKRFAITESFNKNNKQVLCCNILAAGVGLDLIGCHYVAFVDCDDTWENMSQAISRFSRIGQKSSVVSVYYLVGLQTIEDCDKLRKLDSKHETAKRIVDGRRLEKHERILHDR